MRLYGFNFRDPISGRRTDTPYKATVEDIRTGCAQWTFDRDPERGLDAAPGMDPRRRDRFFWTVSRAAAAAHAAART